jgi:adenylate kinase family enzyme
MHTGPLLHQRIVVVGATGCGKSTLAERLARRLGLGFIELDGLFWKPGWVESSKAEFRARVDAATRAPGWVLAGNYGMCRDIVWPRAEAVIWLDYPFLLILGRLLRRTWQRWRRQELLWGTNIEPLGVHLRMWSKDSLVNSLFRTYWLRKRTYPLLLAQPEHAHLRVYRFSHPRQTEAWFRALGRVHPPVSSTQASTRG